MKNMWGVMYDADDMTGAFLGHELFSSRTEARNSVRKEKEFDIRHGLKTAVIPKVVKIVVDKKS